MDERQPVPLWRLQPVCLSGGRRGGKGGEGALLLKTGLYVAYALYCHSHGAAHEAGHFHTVRLFADRTVHLVAISMTPDGWPQALFTLNLWAIGDAYESAASLKQYSARFRLREQAGPLPLVRFVNPVFQAFLPEIERLQEEKIATLARHRVSHPDRNVFEDRSLEILSRVAIDVRARAGRVTPALCTS